MVAPVGLNRCVARRRHDPLVGGQQIVGVGVEVGDPPDHCRACDEVIASGQQPCEQLGIAGVTLDELEALGMVVGLGYRTVLGEVVDADHLVAAAQEFLDHVAANETGRPGDQDLAHLLPLGSKWLWVASWTPGGRPDPLLLATAGILANAHEHDDWSARCAADAIVAAGRLTTGSHTRRGQVQVGGLAAGAQECGDRSGVYRGVCSLRAGRGASRPLPGASSTYRGAPKTS